MKRIIGTQVAAGMVRNHAPAGYLFAPPGYGLIAGHIFAGPDSQITTTVCLNEGDDGGWFKELVKSYGGVCKEVE